MSSVDDLSPANLSILMVWRLPYPEIPTLIGSKALSKHRVLDRAWHAAQMLGHRAAMLLICN